VNAEAVKDVKAGHLERRLDAFEMKGLREILLVSWTAKKTNEWIVNKAGVRKELSKQRS